MAQAAINMHSSQISHGIVMPDSYAGVGNLALVTGYTPSMIKVIVLENDLDPIAYYAWYSTDPDNIYTGNGVQDSFVTVTATGFVVDMTAVAVLHQAADALIWETYGCENASSGSNAAAAVGNDAMDFIQPVPVDDDDDDEY